MTRNAAFIFLLALAAVAPPVRAQPFKAGDYVAYKLGPNWYPCVVNRVMPGGMFGLSCGAIDYVAPATLGNEIGRAHV